MRGDTQGLLATPWRYRLTAFDARYNTAARPFDWRFTHKDLNGLLVIGTVAVSTPALS